MDDVEVQSESEFGKQLTDAIAKYRCYNIVETGTYLGRGTTTTLWKACRIAGIMEPNIITIECDPRRHRAAYHYFEESGMDIIAWRGLTVPRSKLPTPEEIHHFAVANPLPGVAYDHAAEDRASNYFNETHHQDCREDLLVSALEHFSFCPDLVLLDSAGHLGYLEFQIFSETVLGECLLALDDTKHLKHHRSVQDIEKDSRFQLLSKSDQRFGSALYHFRPTHK